MNYWFENLWRLPDFRFWTPKIENSIRFNELFFQNILSVTLWTVYGKFLLISKTIQYKTDTVFLLVVCQIRNQWTKKFDRKLISIRNSMNSAFANLFTLDSDHAKFDSLVNMIQVDVAWTVLNFFQLYLSPNPKSNLQIRLEFNLNFNRSTITFGSSFVPCCLDGPRQIDAPQRSG